MKTRDLLRRQCLTGIFFTLRMELNMLRGSKKGFLFMLTTTGFLLALFGLRVINEILFVALMGPVFAIASVLYFWTYHKYEKGADENQD